MQLEEAIRLRRRNQKDCSHPDIEKEYYLGGQTGDFVFTQCGKNYFGRDEWEAELRGEP